MISFIKIHLLLLAVQTILNQANGHTVEVRHCLTTEGKLRIFLEHWHNDIIETVAAAGTIDVAIEELNYSQTVVDLAPTGIINNINLNNGENLPGCVGNGTPVLSSICTEETAEHDWVYFDFDFSCEIPSSYTILKGNTDILQKGCKELLPVTIVPALVYCPGSPSASPSISLAPSIKKEPTNCFTANNPDALPKESCNLLTSRSSCESERCIWFNSDQYCGSCDDFYKKNACNNQRYCEWFDEQPSASPTVQPSITPSGSPPLGLCFPSDPVAAMSTTECRQFTSRKSCQEDSGQCVWFNSDKICGTCYEMPGKNWCLKKGCSWVFF